MISSRTWLKMTSRPRRCSRLNDLGNVVVNGTMFCKWSRLSYLAIVALYGVRSKQMVTLEFLENMVENGIVL